MLVGSLFLCVYMYKKNLKSVRILILCGLCRNQTWVWYQQCCSSH